MLKNDSVVKRYSESFKLKVLSELSSGKFTKNEIQRLYEISPGALLKWIKKYGRFDLLNKRVRIETMDDIEKLKKLEEENKQLREMLVDSHIDKIMLESHLKIVAKRHGYKSVEELKKKINLPR